MPSAVQYVQAILVLIALSITVGCVKFLRWCWRIYRDDPKPPPVVLRATVSRPMRVDRLLVGPSLAHPVIESIRIGDERVPRRRWHRWRRVGWLRRWLPHATRGR